jgi:hypothetical protein
MEHTIQAILLGKTCQICGYREETSKAVINNQKIHFYGTIPGDDIVLHTNTCDT